jgi:hypothetical protein
MRKRWFLYAQCIAVLSLCPAAGAQSTPSVADAARQVRKDKAQASSGRVFTNDDLPSGGGAPSSALGGSGATGAGSVLNFDSAQRAIDDAEIKIARLDSMDRATLVKTALLQVKDVDFPGRRAWEDKLWDAKLTYVQQGREFVAQSRQLLSTAQGLRNSADGQKVKPDDPKVQDFLSQLRQTVQNGVRAESVFQTVVIEGWDLSKKAAPAAPTATSPETLKPQQ